MLREDLRYIPSKSDDDEAVCGTFIVHNGVEYVDIGQLLNNGTLVQTLIVDNPLAACQSLYIVNIGIRAIGFPVNEIRREFPIYGGSLHVVSQTLVKINGQLYHHQTNWLRNAKYLRDYLNNRAIQMASSTISEIEQGYLGMMIKLKRKLPTWTYMEALYGLNGHWMTILTGDEIYRV
jgi:hypothetical protein